ncbi:MAG: hypothetical protein AAF249_16395 [Pseudomonadota bacterium]
MNKLLRNLVIGAIAIGGVAGGFAYANHHTSSGFSTSEAYTVVQTGSFALDMTPDEALPLFTGPGERLWAPGWNPSFLNGDGYEEGTVFVTGGHGDTTYWYVKAYDTSEHRASYVRVTPGADLGSVDVQLVSDGKDGSTVIVSYRLTGLSEAGNESLRSHYSEEKYAEMMEEWRSLINDNRAAIDAHFAAR